MLLKPLRNLLLFVMMLALPACVSHAGPSGSFPAPTLDAPLAATSGQQTAVFAGGCFWGVQSVFERVKGVVATTAGYSGGTAATATYKQVSSETTGHAESVKVVFDPSRITYGQLLRIFFSVVHDPTELNRQGPDVGTSYRSVIFYGSDEQKRIASAYIAQLDALKIFPKRIVTEVTPLKAFYAAEAYHQDYALHNPDNPYIQVCDRPKITELKKQYPDLFVDYKGSH
jgi:peptide-methionine (S)-S-oxide reductase